MINETTELWVYLLVVGLLIFARLARFAVKSPKLEESNKKPPNRRFITVKKKTKYDEPNWRERMKVPQPLISVEKVAAKLDIKNCLEEALSPVASGLRAPPNSPVSNYVIPERYYEEQEHGDIDSVRRKSYLKKQVTDGEVMERFEIEEKVWKICLIFVYGIEYHYVTDEAGVASWELPVLLKSKCDPWFLHFSKHKQGKFKLPLPPVPIEHTPALDSATYFTTPILYY